MTLPSFTAPGKPDVREAMTRSEPASRRVTADPLRASHRDVSPAAGRRSEPPTITSRQGIMWAIVSAPDHASAERTGTSNWPRGQLEFCDPAYGPLMLNLLAGGPPMTVGRRRRPLDIRAAAKECYSGVRRERSGGLDLRRTAVALVAPGRRRCLITSTVSPSARAAPTRRSSNATRGTDTSSSR